ncbi:MAG: hypothetical protein GY903_22895 [Fuerstiella sp.]|nr:hypothetical protein [Fuerstiella sp.]MCP4857341.1 hypothetical protein [Fuerstiella sp.]
MLADANAALPQQAAQVQSADNPLAPFHPDSARVWDKQADHKYVRREKCGNNGDDHQLQRGIEWDQDSRAFVAHGKGWVGEEYREGLMMLAFPNGNVLNAEWPVTIPRDKWFRVRYALTNQAAAGSNGLKFTITASDKQGKKHVVLDQVLPRGDNKLHVREFRPDFDVEKLTFSHDNLGEENWDVLWFYPEITNSKTPVTTEIVRTSKPAPRPLAVSPVDVNALRLAIGDLVASFGKKYPRGNEFLDRLSAAEELAGDAGSQVLTTLQREALVANPLVSDHPILFVTRPQYSSHYHAIDTLFVTGEHNPDRGIPHSELFRGGGTMKTIDLKTGKLTILLEVPEGIVRDPDIHFDGERIVCAIRNHKDEDYHIYEVSADTGDLKRLTRATGVSDFDPIYLPDDTIVFSSTREPKYNMCSRDVAANLFRMEPDGANIFQITKNTLFDNHAELMPDGRILYARWEYVDRNFGDAHGLWTVNPDGTNQAIYWGNNTAVPGAAFNAHIIPGTQQVLCIFGPHHDRLWGALALIDPRHGIDGRPGVMRTWPAETINWVRKAGGFDCDAFSRLKTKYEDAWPLNDKYFLCSRMTGVGEETGIYLIDIFGNELLLHTESPGCYDPMPLTTRTRPPVIPSRRNFNKEPGRLYVNDVYQGTHMKGVRRGSVKWLRVVESPEKRHWSPGSWGAQGYTAPGMNWHSLENKRILGTVPVEEDGSAYLSVPSDTFVYFQLLDEEKMMVQSMRSGTVLQSGEWVGCVGCHDDRHAAPAHYGNKKSLALQRAPSQLNGWYGKPRLFGFMAEVQPVFDRHCVECHDYNKPAGEKLNLAPDRLIGFNTAYNELWRKGFLRLAGGGPAENLPAYSWGSHASRLIREMRQPTVAEHKDIKLSPEEFDRVVTWLDLNGVYYPTYACAYPNSLTGRSPLNTDQLQRLAHLTGINSGQIRSHHGNPGPQVNFDRPELSPCLAAFSDRSAPAYQEALAIIQAGRKMLTQRPRADMPGFVPCEIDQRRELKYKTRQKIEERNREAIRQGIKVYDS